MHHVAACGLEVRFQPARTVKNDKNQDVDLPEGNLILVRFIGTDGKMRYALVGRRFQSGLSPEPYFQEAMRLFPMDGLDMVVQQGRVLPRGETELKDGIRSYKIRKSSLWLPRQPGDEIIGSLTGWGVGLERKHGDWFLVPYASVQINEGADGSIIRTAHARFFPPFDDRNRVADANILLRNGDKPGELPEHIKVLQEGGGQVGLMDRLGNDTIIEPRQGYYYFGGFAVQEETAMSMAMKGLKLETAEQDSAVA